MTFTEFNKNTWSIDCYKPNFGNEGVANSKYATISIRAHARLFRRAAESSIEDL